MEHVFFTIIRFLESVSDGALVAFSYVLVFTGAMVLSLFFVSHFTPFARKTISSAWSIFGGIVFLSVGAGTYLYAFDCVIPDFALTFALGIIAAVVLQRSASVHEQGKANTAEH